MAQRRNGRTNGNGRRQATRGSNGNGHAERRVDLNEDETRILKDACEMLRHSLPVYLMSSKPELRLINRVMRKLR